MINTTAVIFILLMMFPCVSYSGQIGSTAPSFNLADINGQDVSLEQFKGKVVFLTFWAPWCASCREELPELEKLNKKYSGDHFAVIGISVGSSAAALSKFLQKVPVTFPVLVDERDNASDAYRVSSLPVVFVIAKDGIIRYKHKGFGNTFLPLFEKEIVELLKQ